MKVLVTGGAGQVGSAVADLLLARGDAVLSIDNFATGRRDNLAAHPRLTKMEGSIVDNALVERLFGEFVPDVVGHTAASYKDPDDWYSDAQVNVLSATSHSHRSPRSRMYRWIAGRRKASLAAIPISKKLVLRSAVDV